jgi:hypothetical protein
MASEFLSAEENLYPWSVELRQNSFEEDKRAFS